MTEKYQVKFKRDRSVGIKFFSGMGFEGPMSWNDLAERIIEKGIVEVEKLRHANSHQLNREEILELWKAVEKRRLSNQRTT